MAVNATPYKIFTCLLVLQSKCSYTMNNMSCQTQHSRVGNSQVMSGKLMTPWGCGLQWIPICDHDLTVVVHETCSVSKCPDNYSWKTCCVVCEIAMMLPWRCRDIASTSCYVVAEWCSVATSVLPWNHIYTHLRLGHRATYLTTHFLGEGNRIRDHQWVRATEHQP